MSSLSLSPEIAGLYLARAVVDFALTWLVQSTLLILAGLALASALSRWGAAAQSIVYRATLAAIVLCPFFSWFLSASGITGFSLALPITWSVPVREASESPAPPVVGSASDTNLSAPIVPASALGPPTFNSNSVASPNPSASRFEPLENRDAPTRTPSLPLSAAEFSEDLPSPNLRPESPQSASLTSWGLAAVAFTVLWISIASVGVIRLVQASRRLTRIRLGALAADEATLRVCRELSHRLGIEAPPVLVTPFVPGPCLTGWRRPAILLPDESDPRFLGDVLTHELAHLVRRDVPWHLLRKTVTTVFFFQPLLWHLSRRIEMTAEEVCDDYVVEQGHDRAEYAHRLVEVAAFAGVPTAIAAVAMIAQRSILAQRVARIMDRSRMLSTTTSRALMVAILTVIGMGALAMGLLHAAPRNLSPVASNARESIPVNAGDFLTQPLSPIRFPPLESGAISTPLADDPMLPSREKKGDLYTVRGQVRTPEGEPAAGAKVTVRRLYWTGSVPWTPVASVVADANGRFALPYRDPDGDGRGGAAVTIDAQADGFGVQWESLTQIDPSKPFVLNLVPEYPIKGRIVDPLGKPIEGVNIRFFDVRRSKPGQNLSPWIAAVKSGALFPFTCQALDSELPGAHETGAQAVRSDKDGRFTIRGIGAECVAQIELRHETIAYRVLSIATRAMEPLPRKLWTYSGLDLPPTKDTVYGADFTYSAAPTRIVQGTVSDAATGEPIAGADIGSDFIAGSDHLPKDMLRTKSDAQGRYRLVGLPEGNGPDLSDFNVLRILPNGDVPYLMRMVSVSPSQDSGPQTVNVKLSRGLWISGRVTEKRTGKPVRACVQYLPYLDNPNTRDRPEFPPNENMDGDMYWIITDAEGKYRTPGLPGRAIMCAYAPSAKYITGVGASEIPGYAKYSGEFPTFRANGNASARWFHALKEINPDMHATKVGCDFVLDPGLSTRMTVLDDQGKPLSGCTVSFGESDSSSPGEFLLPNLKANESCGISIYHSGRNLGKIVTLAWKDDKPLPITVALEKCAMVKGRLTDADGVPLKGQSIRARPFGTGRMGPVGGVVHTRVDGAFVLPHLPTGCDHYKLYAIEEPLFEVEVADKVEIKAGQTIDLGTLQMKPKK